MNRQDTVIQSIVALGEKYDEIRAIILTSSRANPDSPQDILSDYDVEIFARDPAAFGQSDEWFEALGPVLATYREEPSERYAGYTRLVLYEDGAKIDIGIADVDVLNGYCRGRMLPVPWDIGYKVLVDKDGAAASLPSPTHKAFIPTVPTHSEYTSVVNEFWWDSTYVSRYLWRDDLTAITFVLQYLKDHYVRRMLEWSIEIDRGWAWKPGHHGRGLARALDPDTRRELAETYAGADIEELWESLFRTGELFRKVAIRVADGLGCQYLYDLDRRVTIYNQSIRRLDRNAASREELATLLRESFRESPPCQAPK